MTEITTEIDTRTESHTKRTMIEVTMRIMKTETQIGNQVNTKTDIQEEKTEVAQNMTEKMTPNTNQATKSPDQGYG